MASKENEEGKLKLNLKLETKVFDVRDDSLLSEVTRDDLFSCSICYFPFNESENRPKLLSCHHTFCEVCLAKILQQNDKLRCPVCAEECVLGTKGIDSLSTNYYLYKFIDMLKSLQLNSQEKNVPSTLSSISSKSKDICIRHGNTEKFFWCNTCNEKICIHCLGIDHSVQNHHDVKDLNEVILSLQKHVIINIKSLKRKIAEMKELQMAIDAKKYSNLIQALSALQNIFKAPSKNCQNTAKELMDPPEKISAFISEYCSSEKFKYDPNFLTSAKNNLDNILLYFVNIEEFLLQKLKESEVLQESKILLSVIGPEIHFDYGRLYCIRCGELCTIRNPVEMGKDDPCPVKFTGNYCKKCGIVIMEFPENIPVEKGIDEGDN